MLKQVGAFLLLSAILVAQNPGKPAATSSDVKGKSWWEYVRVLAADDMEGRETGSEGLRKAAAYIV